MSNNTITMPEEIHSAVKKFFETPIQELFVGKNQLKPSVYSDYGIDPDKPTPLYVLIEELIKDNEQTKLAIEKNDPTLFPKRKLMYMLIHLSTASPDAAPEFFSLKVRDFFAYMGSRVDRKLYIDTYHAILLIADHNYNQTPDTMEKPPKISSEMDFKTIFSIAFSSYTQGCLLRQTSKEKSEEILDATNSMMASLTMNIYSAMFNRTDSGISLKPIFLGNPSTEEG